MTEFETAQIAAQITAALIAAKATVAAATVTPMQTHVAVAGLGTVDAVSMYREVLAELTRNGDA